MQSTSPPPVVVTPRRLGRLLLLIALLLLALGVIGVLLLVLHFRRTPSFADYLRTRPVAAAVFDDDGAGQVLDGRGSWGTGSVDPFALAADDPDHARCMLRFQVDIRHGDEVLLQLLQELAVAEQRQSRQRVGAALRTVELTTGDAVRATVRTHLHDLDRVLEPGAGSVTFDVLLGAGSGRDRAVVLATAPDELPSFEPGEAPGMVVDLLARALPWSGPPEAGLLHRVRRTGWLSWQELPGGSQGAGLGEAMHEVSTQEYSYEVQVKMHSFTPGGGDHSVESSWRRSYSWNHTVW